MRTWLDSPSFGWSDSRCTKCKPPHLATERGWGGENPTASAGCEVRDLYTGVARILQASRRSTARRVDRPRGARKALRNGATRQWRAALTRVWRGPELDMEGMYAR